MPQALVDGGGNRLPSRLLSGVSSDARCLRNASAKGCFIGNAGTLALSAVQGSVAARMRVDGGEESTSVCVPPTFSA